MSELERIWDQLIAEGPKDPGWHYRRPAGLSAPFDVFAAIDGTSRRPAVLMEMESSAVPTTLQRYPEIAGFEIFPESVEAGSAGRVRICLRLSLEEHRDIFTLVCKDLLSHVADMADPRSAMAGLLERLRVWRAFMEKHGGAPLSREAVVGLCAELIVMRDLILPAVGAMNAVDAWMGPLGNVHDFVLEGCSIEVKGTTAVQPELIQVSSFGQLDETVVKQLFLCHVQLLVGEGDVGLANLVDSLESHLADSSPLAAMRFGGLILRAGYLREHGDAYRELSFGLRQIRAFSVKGDFPRLRSSDLPRGVHSGTYAIQFGACLTHETSLSCVGQALRRETDV